MSAAKKERVMLRVIKGGLVPADPFSQQALRQRGYKVGDIVAGEIRKPRNPGFHRLAHQLGAVIAENIEEFSALKAHDVLKRLQLEGNIACDEIAVNFPGIGPCTYRIPQSLSYESLDDGAFREVMTRICAYIHARYWPSVTPKQIENMASCWIEAA